MNTFWQQKENLFLIYLSQSIYLPKQSRTFDRTWWGSLSPRQYIHLYKHYMYAWIIFQCFNSINKSSIIYIARLSHKDYKSQHTKITQSSKWVVKIKVTTRPVCSIDNVCTDKQKENRHKELKNNKEVKVVLQLTKKNWSVLVHTHNHPPGRQNRRLWIGSLSTKNPS